MNDNIISPTLTNGITITVMALLGVGALFLLVQGGHALFNRGG